MSDASSTEQTYTLPSAKVFTHAAKIAIVEDRPIMLDYWVDSLNSASKIIIGVRENGEKLLVKSEDEYTSPVGKIYKVDDSYICVTENSIYLVSSNVKSKRIS
jgi:hypothetical protein